MNAPLRVFRFPGGLHLDGHKALSTRQPITAAPLPPAPYAIMALETAPDEKEQPNSIPRTWRRMRTCCGSESQEAG